MGIARELAELGSSYNSGGVNQIRNRIINGAMVIDQRNAGASVTVTNTTNDTYALDRWAVYGSNASRFSVQQNAGAVTPPAGFTNYMGVTSLSAYSVTSSDLFRIAQFIEGFNIADLGWGTANAATITLSFWVRSSLTGTFGGALANGPYNRGYPFTYTINAANTWEQKSVTIVGDTTGTWSTLNNLGIRVNFSLGTGAANSGTAGAWQASGAVSATGATSVVGTNGATFYITGVQLEKGTQSTSFEYRQHGQELALCQRYFQRGSGGFIASGRGGNACSMAGTFPVEMRASSTITFIQNFSLFFADINIFSATGITIAGGASTKSFSIDTLALNGSPGSTNSGYSLPSEGLSFSAEL